ncbi:hypothetical protein F2P81_018029 [Scophthalmus maximus]|uniref:Uncharacterized protein n=1 Tax=Scophthalmus maximus TaxID=52904 RepID=A0A6A4SDF3_SCOMX|nr:hypothetical protein F2P81_018029 [Scophthalmus maximus]
MSGLTRLLRPGAAASRRPWRRTDAAKCVASCGSDADLSGPRPGPRPERRRYATGSSAGTRPVRIGCASGFWGDTATSGTDAESCRS